MTTDIASVVKKTRVTSGFEFVVILVGYLGVSCPCALNLYLGTLSNLD